MSFERPQLKQLIDRMKEPRRFIQVLYGPRQVGKTTMANQLIKKLKSPNLFITADAIAAPGEAWLTQQWETARIKWKISGSKEFILVIDEIQKIANWSEVVKRMWDEDSRVKNPIKVVLLGSSRLMLQQGLTESLTGRFEATYLGHWSFTEMNKAFGLKPDEFIWFGSYPGAADLVKDEKRWKKYVSDALIEPSISKDILMLTRVDKPALLRKLFELGCLYSGQILSYTKILGQLLDAGNTTTLAHYLNLLDTAGLLSGIEKFSGDEIRKRSSSPKFQVHNTALITALQAQSFKQIMNQPDRWGRWIESAMGAHLLNSQMTGDLSLYYWRQSSYEVDFVLQLKDKVIGIEVKTGLIKNTRGIEMFQQKFKPDKMIMVGKDGITWQEFLKLNPIELF